MPTIIIKVDLDCSRCHRKIEKVLDRIREKGEFVIDDIEYDDKNNKVIVTGPFDPDKLADKLCCKACKIIKEIEIVEPPPPKVEKPPPKVEETPAELPNKEETTQPPPPTEVVKTPEPTEKVESKLPPPTEVVKTPEPTEKVESKLPPPAPTEVLKVPYPWPYPYPFPAWPSDCCCHHGHGGCHCCSCGKQEPAPEPPQPQNIMPQCYPQPSYPCGGYKIVCEEDPSYACSMM